MTVTRRSDAAAIAEASPEVGRAGRGGHSPSTALSGRSSPWLRYFGLVLASLATSLSLLMAILSGMDRGAVVLEQIIWAGVGVLAVLGAHGLLAIWVHIPRMPRLVVGLLWLVCMGVVAQSHMSRFLLAQQHAGNARVAALYLMDTSPKVPTRPVEVILKERAKLEAQIAALGSLSCKGECASRAGRIRVLQTQRDALTAEAASAQRALDAQLSRVRMEGATRMDPLTHRLIAALRVTEAEVGVVSAVLIFLVIDGLACLGWWLLLGLRTQTVAPMTSVNAPLSITDEPTAMVSVTLPDSVTVAADVVVPVAPVTTVSTDAPGQVSVATRSAKDDASMDEYLQRVLAEYYKSRLRLTVDSVREFLHCGQAVASSVTRRAKACVTPSPASHVLPSVTS